MTRYKILLLAIVIAVSGNNFLFAQQGRGEENIEQYELVSIEFHGNQSIPGSVLETIISSKSTPNWFYKLLHKVSGSLGLPPQYFDSLKIPEDMKALEKYYRDNGFFKARFSNEYNIDKDKKEATLIYSIIEGPEFKIRKFGYQGLDSLPVEFRQKIASDYWVDTTKPFSRGLVEQETKPVISFLRDNGYMQADVNKPEVFVYTDSNFVDIRVGLTSGRRYKVNALEVEKKGPGKEYVEDTLIKKIVSITPGDYYSAEEKQRAQVRLYRTNLFSSVLISGFVPDTNKSLVNLNITGDITKMNDLSPEIIINNQESAFNVGLGTTYTRKNFLGNARTFTLGGSFAVQDVFNVNYSKIFGFVTSIRDTSILGYVDLRASVEQPFLFDRKISSKLEGYFTINKQKQYRSLIYGTKISLDFELPRNVYINSLVTYYQAERTIDNLLEDYVRTVIRNNAASTDVPLTPAEEDSIVSNLRSSRNITSIIGADIGANKTNDIMFPTKGYNLSLTLEEGNLLPSIFKRLGADYINVRSQFYRLQTTVSYFPNVYNSPVDAFGIKFRLGYLQTYQGTKNDVPLNRFFSAGGSNSVRGWRARQLIPKAANIPILTAADFQNLFLRNIPLGGTFLMEGSFETRNRIIGSLGSAAFIDYGNTFTGYNSFSFNQLAVAVGLGLRYYSSFAPIRVDIGLKAYDPYERKAFMNLYRNQHFFQNYIEIHFGIGEAF
ncbi:MAG: BamA/TamA family outer membrane protein [Ignavibacteria bacterium]|jgi:outer membrane protein assembly factor BamA|nr:BamA/TamA family outer membrane protein [Ignavibacteria bacterium]MCU7503615.1 BamA/TamA family outer membrane protein [Ignavibacteria bacterium]MCU7516731.1 BamA/TamA family outer membrane protein [Ignavibacteria bacterium]